MVQKIELRKTRDFSAKINITFEFIRQNFKMLAKAIIYISGPFILVEGLFMGIYQQKTLALGKATSGIFGDFLSEVFFWFGIGMIFLVFAYITSLIVVNEFVRLYEIKEDPGTIEVAEIWEGVKENFFKMFGAGMVIILVTSVGFVFLILPGIYLGVTLSLMAPILIIEKRSINEAFTRCFNLITEKWWSTFGLLLVTSLIVSFMGFVFQLPQTVFTFLIAFHKTSNGLAEPALYEQIGIMVSSVIATIGSNMLQSIVFLALIFQFYNLVERREAQGLLNKLDSFGKTDVNAPRHDETY